MNKLQESDIRKDRLLPILKSLPQWICWASHRSPSINKKIPLDTRRYSEGRNEFQAVGHNDQRIWMDYDKAKRKQLANDEIDGIGFVVEGYNVCYIDIDNCVDSSELTIDSEIQDIIDEVATYTEISSSGTGLHLICNGELGSYGWSRPDSPIEISAFDKSWVAVTERHIAGTPKDVKNCPESLEKLCKRYRFKTYGGW